MRLPEGQLRARRVVPSLAGPLDDALDWTLTGYLRLESDGLLLDNSGATILTFKEGIPVAATQTENNAAGAEALAGVGVDGLYRVELRKLAGSKLPAFHRRDRARVPPTLPAKQLVGNSELVTRTREAAPERRLSGSAADEPGLSAVESFLDNGDTISSIRDRARSEARSRADEWGFETVDRDTER
jgi:hypothetical protein